MRREQELIDEWLRKEYSHLYSPSEDPSEDERLVGWLSYAAVILFMVAPVAVGWGLAHLVLYIGGQ